MREAHAGEALGLGFHHRAEGVAAVGALLLQVEAEGGEAFFAQGFGQQRPIAVGAQGALHGMRRKTKPTKRGQVHFSAADQKRGQVHLSRFND